MEGEIATNYQFGKPSKKKEYKYNRDEI